jgi:hypothetical protein
MAIVENPIRIDTQSVEIGFGCEIVFNAFFVEVVTNSFCFSVISNNLDKGSFTTMF